MKRIKALTATKRLQLEIHNLDRRAYDLRYFLIRELNDLAHARRPQHAHNCAHCITVAIYVHRQTTTLAAITERLYDRLTQHTKPL